MNTRFVTAMAALVAAVALSACGQKTDESAVDTALRDASHKPFFTFADDAPVAEKRPVEIEQHGETRIDKYAWLRDDNWQEVLRNPEVLREDVRDQLTAENSYYESATGELEQLRDTLFEEMRGRIKEDDSSVPSPDGPYAYAVRYREGGEYPIFVRTPRGGGGRGRGFLQGGLGRSQSGPRDDCLRRRPSRLRVLRHPRARHRKWRGVRGDDSVY